MKEKGSSRLSHAKTRSSCDQSWGNIQNFELLTTCSWNLLLDLNLIERKSNYYVLKRPTFKELIEPPNSSWISSIRDDTLNYCTFYGCQQTDDLPTWAWHGSSIRKAQGHTLLKICLQFTIELNNNQMNSIPPGTVQLPLEQGNSIVISFPW